MLTHIAKRTIVIFFNTILILITIYFEKICEDKSETIIEKVHLSYMEEQLSTNVQVGPSGMNNRKRGRKQ